MKSTIRIATRQSNLALWQTNWVAEQIKSQYKDINIELVKITTKGDKILDKSLAKIGGKGLFVKELEQAILDDRADIAVHSLKDMPAEQPDGLELAAYCKREDFRDVLISKEYESLSVMPLGATIGTSSVRRMAQVKIFRPDLNIKLLRGNVDTRLNKALANDSEYDGIILACAGVLRLEKEYLIKDFLAVNNFLPAPGQGIVTIETRQDDLAIKNIIQSIECKKTTIMAKAERAFNRVMGGSCQIPIAALAELEQDEINLTLQGQVANPDGSQQVKASMTGSIKDAVDIGEQLASKILNSGGRAIILALTT